MENIMLIDKPKGITSFDVIRELRKRLNIRKIGHAGTLDPQATGLLIIGIEEGTKKLKEYLRLPKKYEAEVLLGTLTDTWDLEGKVQEIKDVPKLDQEQIKSALDQLKGDIDLKVPKYSAIKKAGKPLYKYAREGDDIEPPVKRMHVISTKILAFNKNLIIIEFEVKSGTYIRSLAVELGRMLGTVATLQNLRRTTIGDFKVEDAEKL
jgi:tRNA pseudouridine55 synthase